MELDDATGEAGPPRLPPRRWELTAPESFMLRHAASAGYDPEEGLFKRLDRDSALGDRVLGFALMELIAGGALRLDRAWVGRRHRPYRWHVEWLLGRGPVAQSVTDPVLVPVLELQDLVHDRRPRVGLAPHDHAVHVHGVLLYDVHRAVTNTWRGSRGYLYDAVVASMRRRGLLWGRCARTPAGDRAAAGLEAWLTIGKRAFRSWAPKDPAWARAYIEGAGAATLLANEIHPALARAAAAVAGNGADSELQCIGRLDGSLVSLDHVRGALGSLGASDLVDPAGGDFGGHFGGDWGGGDFGGGE